MIFVLNILNFSNSKLLLIRKLSNLNFFFILISFLILEYAFINSDFSLSLIANNSHTSTPMIYKISGLWGNHEGSMLLWILILTFFTFLVSKTNALKISQSKLEIQKIIKEFAVELGKKKILKFQLQKKRLRKLQNLRIIQLSL